jgi:putative ABC transport system ATP-binding protein
MTTAPHRNGKDAPEMLLKLDSLTKVYRTAEVETTALNKVDVAIGEGEFVAIMGPSGCGKSTLLNIVGMLDGPSSGKYYFRGDEVGGYSEARLARLRKQNIGFVFQSFNLIDELTVEGNIELALLYHRISQAERKRRVGEAMERMQVAHRAQHYPPALSGGQQQRVAIARAVVSRPSLILADEPTGNLDSQHGDEVMRLLQELNSDGTTIVMVTHSAAHAQSARRTINLFDGRVVTENLRAAS